MNLIESDFLPYSAGELPPGPWLVLAPHPDDETFGMGGTILRATGAGIAVDVIVLTDGALGGEDDGSLVATREREALAASAILGLRTIEFWREPDRGLEPKTQLVERLVREIRSRRPGTLFFPSITEPHPDHRAAAIIGWEASRRSSFAALPVAYEISSQGPVNLLLDITGPFPDKRRAMDVYASQEADRPYTRRIEAQNIARTWSLPAPVEYAEAFLLLATADRPLPDAVEPLFERYRLGLVDAHAAELHQAAAPSSDPRGADDPLHALQEELRHMKESRSWKLTAPYRWLGGRIARWRRAAS